MLVYLYPSRPNNKVGIIFMVNKHLGKWIITIYPTVKMFILFHREKLYFESFRGEIKDLFYSGIRSFIKRRRWYMYCTSNSSVEIS